MLALGGTYSADGNYSVHAALVLNMDADGDGIVTEKEVAAYKESKAYQKASYEMALQEIEKTKGKLTVKDMEKFVSENTVATKEQKDLFSVITNISDSKLKDYIMKAIGGSSAITTEQFTLTVDSDGDGIVTKDELQKYVSFVTQFYNADKNNKTDRLLTGAQASGIEPFKSNPDLWYSFSLTNGSVSLTDVWNYLKTH